MKILIVIIRWKGGVGRVVKNLEKELKRKGHKVEVISREDDLKCYSTKQAFFKLRKEVESKDYDILYSQDWSFALPLLDKKNHYVNFNGIEKSKSRFLQKLVGKIKGKKVTVIGDLLKKLFPKSTLAYVGVDLKEFKDLNLKRIKGTVGFANFETDDYNYGAIKKAVEKQGMKLVKTNMKLSKKELVKFYNTIETFISLPSKNAGFNMTWVEAMACKVPKIIGNKNGVGKSININHVEDFKSIEDVLKKARVMRDYHINKEFNWETQAKKILELFSKQKK